MLYTTCFTPIRLALCRAVIFLLIALVAACTNAKMPVVSGDESPHSPRANAMCAATLGSDQSLPEIPFTTDGCSMWPDHDWGECCLVHDMQYWCGGKRSLRKAADAQLRQCVANTGHPVVGALMQLGSSVGGARIFPSSWRWGYGRK